MPATKKRTKKSTKPAINVPAKEQIDLSHRETKIKVCDFEIGTSVVSMRTTYVGIEFGATEDNLHAVILPDPESNTVKVAVDRGKENDTAFALAVDRDYYGLQIDYDMDENEFTFFSEADQEWYYVGDGITLADQIDGADERHADADDDLVISTVLQQLKGDAKNAITAAIYENNRQTA